MVRTSFHNINTNKTREKVLKVINIQGLPQSTQQPWLPCKGYLKKFSLFCPAVSSEIGNMQLYKHLTYKGYICIYIRYILFSGPGTVLVYAEVVMRVQTVLSVNQCQVIQFLNVLIILNQYMKEICFREKTGLKPQKMKKTC